MASNFCRNCGFRLTPGKSFCGNCGTMVSAPVPVPEPVTPLASETTVSPAPQKKKHTGLIVGLICGGVAFLLLICIGLLFVFSRISGSSSVSGTVLDRIEVMEEVSSGKNYKVYDKDFNKKIEEAKWWDYDGTMKSQGVYFSNTKTVAFSVKVDEKTDDKLYYEFYFSSDDVFDKDDLKESLTSASITPSYYRDGTAYYNIECGKVIKPGYYFVIVSKDKSFNKPYAVAYARVLKEISEEG